eukprot:7469145-Prorocentrum_lima.AAC.1
MPGPEGTAKQCRDDGKCEESWRVSFLRTRAVLRGSLLCVRLHGLGGVGPREGTSCCNTA